MPHFFIKSEIVTDGEIIIDDGNSYRHIVKSLRSKIGEKLLLIDENKLQYETVITEISPKIIHCNILNNYVSERDLDFDLFLAQSPLGRDTQKIIVEKATELGVKGIYPIITDNCTISKQLAEKKKEKWEKIMFEASKQCERASIPECFEPILLEQLFEKHFDKVLIFAERDSNITLKKYMKENEINKQEKILVVIGPEGGFSKKEFEYFKNKNFPLITLGNLILKAETAVITALGNIIYEYKG